MMGREQLDGLQDGKFPITLLERVRKTEQMNVEKGEQEP